MRRYADIAEIVPQPTRIAGTWLRPFCLGHHLLFSRLELPYAGDAVAEASLEDILTGITVCAGRSYEWTLESMLSGKWERIVARWTRDARGPWYRRRRIDWHEATEVFRDYLIDGYATPPTWRYDGDREGVSMSSPWELLLMARLRAAGHSESHILNAYLPSLWYEYFALAEIRQLENCRDQKQWKRIFLTEADARRLP